MKSVMNRKIKFREGFRPFAPIVLAERASEYFSLPVPSPYMLLIGQCLHPEYLPAVTHVDGSSRVQTVAANTDPQLHALLREFERQTGCPVLINTSMNVRGEPIVATPAEALDCFLNTDIDAMVLGSYLVEKIRNPQARKDADWRNRFAAD
jgi:carbamoyltransferase